MLVEHHDPAVRALLQHQLAEHGYRVATCAGPLAEGPPARCPLLEGDDCAVVDEADAIVNGLDLTHPANRRLVTALADADPDRPVVVTPHLHARPSSEASGSDHVRYRTVVAPLVRWLHDLLGAPTGRAAPPR